MGKKKFRFEHDDGYVLRAAEGLSSQEIRGHIEADEDDAGAIIVVSWVRNLDGTWTGDELYRISPNIAAGLRRWFKSE